MSKLAIVKLNGAVGRNWIGVHRFDGHSIGRVYEGDSCIVLSETYAHDVFGGPPDHEICGVKVSCILSPRGNVGWIGSCFLKDYD